MFWAMIAVVVTGAEARAVVEPVFGPLEVLNTNAATDTGGSGIRPSVATGSGTSIVVWEGRAAGLPLGSDSDILFARSTDAGETWSPPASVNSDAEEDVARDDYSPRIATDGNGTWIAIWNAGGGEVVVPTLSVSRSVDDGLTWSTPTTYSSPGSIFITYDIASSGTAFVIVWSAAVIGSSAWPGETDLLFVRSGDAGATWSSPTILNDNAPIDQDADGSPRVAAGGAGTWLVVWESPHLSDTSEVMLARSTDDGISWGEATPLNPNAKATAGTDFAPVATWVGGTSWVIIWDSTDSLLGSVGGDLDILFSRSADNGASWSPVCRTDVIAARIS